MDCEWLEVSEESFLQVMILVVVSLLLSYKGSLRLLLYRFMMRFPMARSSPTPYKLE
ncbi:hypothetical protein K431DRAFT_288554 [Polychaeton citri CBS 116435]|uniref:Uncharacterized protein n=1 Tax=Polychaeton citri CBS 116435 TaxID=1314669 RepID=A0A9P4Q0U7_9PEZI|nr:hypothetical protein K431DRAFT_288554 [Polychaeton citri CBS 116435]